MYFKKIFQNLGIGISFLFNKPGFRIVHFISAALVFIVWIAKSPYLDRYSSYVLTEPHAIGAGMEAAVRGEFFGRYAQNYSSGDRPSSGYNAVLDSFFIRIYYFLTGKTIAAEDPEHIDPFLQLLFIILGAIVSWLLFMAGLILFCKVYSSHGWLTLFVFILGAVSDVNSQYMFYFKADNLTGAIIFFSFCSMLYMFKAHQKYQILFAGLGGILAPTRLPAFLFALLPVKKISAYVVFFLIFFLLCYGFFRNSFEFSIPFQIIGSRNENWGEHLSIIGMLATNIQMFCGSYVFLLPFFLLSFGVLFYRGNKFQRFKLLYFLCLIGIFITSRASVQRFFIGLNMIFMLSVPICADLLPPRIQLIMNKISAGLVAGVILLIVFFNINQVQQKLVKICRYSYSLEEKKICDLIDHLPPGEKLYIDKKLRLNTNEFPIKPRYEKIKIIDIINDYHTIPARSQLCSLYIFDDAYRQAFGLAEAGKAGSDFNAFYNNDNIKSVPYRVLLYPHNMRLSIMQPRSQQLKFFRLREKLPLSPFTVDTGKSCVFPAAFLKTGGLFIQEWGYQLTTFSRTNRTVFYLEKILKFRAGKYKICLKAFSNIKDRESQARVFINGRCIAQTELDTTSEVKKQYRILTYLPDFAARWRNKYYPRDIAGTHDFPVNGIYTIGMEIYCCSKETGLRINELEITPCR